MIDSVGCNLSHCASDGSHSMETEEEGGRTSGRRGLVPINATMTYSWTPIPGRASQAPVGDLYARLLLVICLLGGRRTCPQTPPTHQPMTLPHGFPGHAACACMLVMVSEGDPGSDRSSRLIRCAARGLLRRALRGSIHGTGELRSGQA
jgi:hypothetical protein